MQNGDLNWILPGKLLAFAGPTAVAKVLWGYRTFTPEDYWGYFREHGVSAVVRLNNKVLQTDQQQQSWVLLSRDKGPFWPQIAIWCWPHNGVRRAGAQH